MKPAEPKTRKQLAERVHSNRYRLESSDLTYSFAAPTIATIGPCVDEFK